MAETRERPAPSGGDDAAGEGALRRIFRPTGVLRDAPITAFLLALNVGMYLLELLLSGGIAGITAVPERVGLLLGANDAARTFGDRRFETLVTSVFLHWSLIHVGFNMVALRQVGPFVERAVGPARFFPLYVITGIVASATSAGAGWMRATDHATSAGASGAICGVIGAALVIGVRTQGWGGPIPRAMGFWLGLTLLFGLQPGVDNAAHVGGAVSGAAIAAAWRRGFSYTRLAERLIVGACVFVIAGAGIVVAAHDLFDPYALLDLTARVERASVAERAGRCDDAVDALDRARRIVPPRDGRRRRLDEIEGEVRRECRGRGTE